jgi:NTE family protein
MRILNFALQGGGSHGAFTWGVLDALLEDGRVAFEGLSGTSAGAVNAVALAAGWTGAEAAGRDPREGAREKLGAVWQRIGALGRLGTLQQQFLRVLWGGWASEFHPAKVMGAGLRGMVSPYQGNPLGLNPLRDLLQQEIDFERLGRQRSLKVFVSATQVRTGKAVVFGGSRLDLQAVLASTCLPALFHAVEIDGEAYWDGGYSVNPPLQPLVRECSSADIVLVQLNPLETAEVPRSAAGIQDRVSELTFNASLLTQMRAIAFVNRLVEQGAVSDPRCRSVRLHRVDGAEALAEFPASSRVSADPAMIQRLFEGGRQAGHSWLDRHYEAIGQRGTVDIAGDYLDDTWMDPPAAPVRGLRSVGGGFRGWLARMLRR